MKINTLFLKLLLVLLIPIFLFFSCTSNDAKSNSDQSEWIEIFNGKNLDGWINHGQENWYVENGEIICESGPKEEYGYLSTEKFYDDYELVLEFKQEANGNSGVFFRSTLEGTKISGWQVEVAPPNLHTGGIYESYGRGWLIKPDEEKDKALKMGEWNEMRMIVADDKVTTWVNGTEMISLKDKKIGEGKGAIALQIHDGGGIKVRWRNLKVRKIDEAEAKTFAEATKNTWQYIFDGSSTDGWRAYNGTSMPPQWVVKDRTLSFDTEIKLEEEYTGGKDLVYGAKEYSNFDLSFEWKVPEGGNSGAFYHLKEGDYAPYTVSPEYQLLDDSGWEKLNNAKLEPWQKAGADYGMYAVDDSIEILNPAGEWNSSRIKFTEELVEYYLNGVKTVSFVPWSDDWKERKENSKWKDHADYGKYKTGLIGFQDHDSPLSFRNVKIREL